MKKQNIIIIALIAVIIMLSIGILFTSGLLKQTDTMETIALSNTCTVNVTESDVNFTTYADTIKLYNDTENEIEIISYNSEEAFEGADNALGGAVAFAGIRDALTIGENIDDLNGFLLYKCDGYYSAKLVNNSTHDNIVIVCKDLDLLKKIVSSAKFNTNNTAAVEDITNNNANNAEVKQNNVDLEYTQGKVNPDEIPSDIYSRWDTDGDGIISSSEMDVHDRTLGQGDYYTGPENMRDSVSTYPE